MTVLGLGSSLLVIIIIIIINTRGTALQCLIASNVERERRRERGEA